MGGRGSGSSTGGGGGGNVAPQQTAPATPPVAGPVLGTFGWTLSGNPNYSGMSDKEAQKLRDLYDDLYDIDTRMGLKTYTSKTAEGSRAKAPYDPKNSMSQNMNYGLETGAKLNATYKYMDTVMSNAMHPIGKDTVLYRGAHDEIMKTLGLPNYGSLTQSQLSKALTGASWTSKSYYSTSYDLKKNPFLSGPQAGGRQVVMNIKAPSQTRMVFGAKSQAEIVLNKGTQFRITGARFTGQTVSPQGSYKSYKQVEIDVEIIGQN